MNPVKDCNKIFLQNTIREIESHNRREEINDCWRHHELLTKIDKQLSKDNLVYEEHNHQREMWAAKKAKLFQEKHNNTTIGSINNIVTSTSNTTSTTIINKEKKKKKHKDKLKKKKSKHKKIKDIKE